MCPCLPLYYLVHVPSIDFVPIGNLPCCQLSPKTTNSAYVFSSKAFLTRRGNNPTVIQSISKSRSCIFLMGCPLQVLYSVVSLVIVQMTHNWIIIRIRNEALSYKPM